MWNEWETMAADIDTFDEYKENVDSIEAFHTHIEESASQILVMICDYGAAYAGMIIQSDSSPKDMYNDFEDFKDCLYEDACKIVKDEIYEDLLGEMKDYYYEGIIQDAKDSISYSEWSEARRDAYNWWSMPVEKCTAVGLIREATYIASTPIYAANCIGEIPMVLPMTCRISKTK